jgi:hypothetical protein
MAGRHLSVEETSDELSSGRARALSGKAESGASLRSASSTIASRSPASDGRTLRALALAAGRARVQALAAKRARQALAARRARVQALAARSSVSRRCAEVPGAALRVPTVRRAHAMGRPGSDIARCTRRPARAKASAATGPQRRASDRSLATTDLPSQRSWALDARPRGRRLRRGAPAIGNGAFRHASVPSGRAKTRGWLGHVVC